MNRLIDGDRLLNCAEESFKQGGLDLKSYKKIKRWILHAPVIQTEGEWSREHWQNEPAFFRDRFVCSACGESNSFGCPDHCPKCGAKMRNAHEVLEISVIR